MFCSKYFMIIFTQEMIQKKETLTWTSVGKLFKDCELSPHIWIETYFQIDNKLQSIE